MKNTHTDRTLKTSLWKFWGYKLFNDAFPIAALMVPFYKNGNIDQFGISIIQGWFFLSVLLLELPTGAISDVFGRKWSMAAGTVVMGLGAVLYPVHTTFWWFLFAETIIATGFALRSGASDAWLIDTMKKAGIGEDDSMITKLRARGYTLNVVGISLASIIGGFVADGFGITVPFYLSAVPMICAIVFALLLPEPPRKSESEQGKFIKTLVSGVTYLARHPRLRKAAIEATLLNTVAYFSLWFFQPMLQELGVSVSYFGWFLTLLIVFETITNELYGRVEDKLSRTGLTKITARSVVIGMIFVTTLWYTWTTSGLWAAGMGAVVTLLILVGGIGFSRTGLMEQYMNQYIEEHNRSTVLSAVSMMMSLGIVVANPIIGWLFTQSPVAAFGLLTAMAISALAMRLRWSEN